MTDDSWGQAYNSGFPNISNIEATQITFNTNITNTGGNTYHTRILIKARSAGAAVGEVNALATHSITVTNADQNFSINITGLDANTEYTAYCASYYYNPATFSNEYIEGALSNPATAVDFKTLGTPPPNYTDDYPTVTNIQETQVRFNTNLTNTGSNTFYTKILIKSRGAGASIAEVSAIAPYTITVNNPDQAYSIDISSLNSGTEYTAYCVSYFYNPATFSNEYIESGAPTGPATAVDFTTAIPLSVSSYNPAQNATNVSTSPELLLTFNQDVEFVTPTVDYKILLRQGGTIIDEFRVAPGYTDGNLSFEADQLTTDRLKIIPYSILNVNTEYHVIIPSDLIRSTASGELFTGITSQTGWRFTTVAQPAWASGYPLTRNVTPASVDFVGQTDKAGTYYYVLTSSATTPSAAQIKAGQDENGVATTFVSGSGAMVANTEFSTAIDISDIGLYDAETAYYIHTVTTENVGSLDSDAATTSFTTLERTAPVTSFDPADGTNDVSILTNVVISFDEPVRMTNGTIIDDSNVSSLITFFRNPANPVIFTATIDAAKQVITITPNSPLDDNTGYDVTIVAVEDYFGNEQASSSTASFNTANVVTWNGSRSSTWSDNQNWDGNFNPGNSAHIPAGVANMPVISTDENVGNLTIEAGASLEINSSGSLVIAQTLSLGSSTSGSGNASLIDNGSSPISVDPAKVSIHQQINSASRYYTLSSPVVGATKANLGIDNSIYVFENPTDTWRALGDNESLTAGRGYLAYTSSNITFSGNLHNNSNYLVSLTRTDGQGFGWNLIGNPYQASLDWDAILAGFKININDAYWVRSNDPGSYGTFQTYSPGGGGTNDLNNEIPSHQAFYVKVNIGEITGSLTMSKTALVRNTQSVLKSAEKGYTRVKLAAVNGDNIDETIIAFNENSEDGIDRFDASKRFGSNSDFVEMFSIEEPGKYAINCKNTIYDELSIPLGVRANAGGTYKIRRQVIENIPGNIDVYLEDRENKEGESLINLREKSEHEFTLSAKGTYTERFALVFKESTATNIGGGKENDVVFIYGHNQSININGKGINGSLYEVYTTDGVIVNSGQLKHDGLNSINIGRTGLYIVRVISGNDIISKKVLLR